MKPCSTASFSKQKNFLPQEYQEWSWGIKILWSFLYRSFCCSTCFPEELPGMRSHGEANAEADAMHRSKMTPFELWIILHAPTTRFMFPVVFTGLGGVLLNFRLQTYTITVEGLVWEGVHTRVLSAANDWQVLVLCLEVTFHLRTAEAACVCAQRQRRCISMELGFSWFSVVRLIQRCIFQGNHYRKIVH